MKWTATTLTFAIIALGAFLVWNRWDAAKNRGYTFGYWGQFNRVGNALAEIPDIAVTGKGGNKDITFEAFMYKVETAEGQELTLWFAEHDPIRKMSGQQLTEALLKKIEAKSSGKQMLNQEN